MGSEQFPSHWQVLPIAETVDALIDYRGKTPKKTNSGIPLVTAKIVKGGTVLPATEYIAEEDYDSWMVRGFPQAGDVVVTTEAPLGEVAQLDDPNVALAQRIVTLRGAKGLLLNDYLRYVMQGSYVQSQMESRATGSTVKGIKQSELRKVLLPIPSLQEQSAIASCLKYLDKKIQLNQQVNQTLEQMAQALFKSWFVDFEPVKAKITVLEAGGTVEDATLAAMTAISGKDTSALAVFARAQPEQYAELKATAELFPAAMQGSELGEIPKGWEVSSLAKRIKLVGGGTPKRSEPNYWGGDICWYSVKDAPSESDIFVIDTTEKITPEGLAKSSTKLLPIGTTIISARGTVGKLALTAVETAMNQSCYGISGGKYSGPFLTYLKVKQCIDVLKRNTHGAVFDTITTNTFDTVNMLTAHDVINSEFEKCITPLFDAIKVNLISNSALKQLRDTLLPKLLSGEITLPEAEQAINEVEHV
ncbi:restriction endonuclease subunit S [Serratia sp. DD3]|uniref:restriction endonuclease subunit S n=1 Tax=Serratia sp. DD3 TaxID=1410619 RepID=UPI0004D7C899|nr:restriction endonuclease subunit S [Serratia sp. DD3]KEY59846.1 EcoKI restriction-modification system protein HsdS [Serratia sp. DD3]